MSKTLLGLIVLVAFLAGALAVVTFFSPRQAQPALLITTPSAVLTPTPTITPAEDLDVNVEGDLQQLDNELIGL